MRKFKIIATYLTAIFIVVYVFIQTITLDYLTLF
jgi:hypothetical protein|nr:MAG TPA: immunity protein [Caudoviricetes sp.]